MENGYVSLNKVALVKPDDLRKRMLEENPVEFIKRFQSEHGLRVRGLEPALHLGDIFGFSRGDIYRAIKQSYHTELMQHLSSLSKDNAAKLLLYGLDYMDDGNVNQVPNEILKETKEDFPAVVYDKLASLSDAALLALPDRARRRTWELHIDRFEAQANIFIDHYLQDRNVIKTSDNMALALEVNKRREKTIPLMDAKKAISGSPMLYEKLCEVVRNRFVATGEPLLCTLMMDLLIVAQQNPSKSAIAPDVAHVMDSLKIKYSNDNAFVHAAKPTELVTSMAEVIDILTQEVFRARDGSLPEKVLLPPPPVVPVVLPAAASSGKARPAPVRSTSFKKAAPKKKAPQSVNALFTDVYGRLKKKRPYVKTITWFEPSVLQHHKGTPIAIEYAKLISHPMDLNTMSAKAKAKSYVYVEQLVHDFELIRDNAVKFNGPGSEIGTAATNIMNDAIKLVHQLALPEFYETARAPTAAADTTVTSPQSSTADDDGEANGGDEQAEDDDFDMDAPAQAPPKLPAVVVRPPLPPARPVSLKAADAAMVLADPNTRHSLAKMMWDLLCHKVAANAGLPRDENSVRQLLWLQQIGENAQSIVQSFLEKKAHDVLSSGPVNPGKTTDVILNSVLPLCARLFTNVPQLHPRLVELCSEHVLAREYLLRFCLFQIRADKEPSAMELLKASAPFADHPGFRRGLSHVLKNKIAVPNVRRFAIEHVFLPRIVEQQAMDLNVHKIEVANAHEFFGTALLSSTKLIREGFFGPEGAQISEYLRTALRGMDAEFYLSSAFHTARHQYEQLFGDILFVGLREALGLPVVPAALNREMSPGSNRPSPSPGTYRPQSASPTSYTRMSGPQSSSPSYMSPT